MKILIKNQKSFGLIEVVVSVGIIAMVLTALMALSSSSTKTSVSSERRLEAANLARFGVNAVRQYYDSGRLPPHGCTYTLPKDVKVWLDTAGNSCSAVAMNSYNINSNLVQIVESQGNWTASTRDQSALSPTNYGSAITISDVSSSTYLNVPNMYYVKSTVYWTEGTSLTPKSVTVSTYLGQWW